MGQSAAFNSSCLLGTVGVLETAIAADCRSVGCSPFVHRIGSSGDYGLARNACCTKRYRGRASEYAECDDLRRFGNAISTLTISAITISNLSRSASAYF